MSRTATIIRNMVSNWLGFYGLLDLGFRAGATQYLVRYLGEGDNEGASECLPSATVALSWLAAVMIVLSVIAAVEGPRMFQLPSDMVREAFRYAPIAALAKMNRTEPHSRY